MPRSISKKNNIIQLHAAVVLMGYWLVSTFMDFFVGQTSQSVSIAYRAAQFLLSLIVLWMCRKDIRIVKGHSLLTFYVITMILYSFRIVVDVFFGPFVGVIPREWFVNDFLFIVVSTFFSLFAMFASAKYLDLDRIVELVFWMGLIIGGGLLLLMDVGQIDYTEDRVYAGRGLHTLSISKFGALEVLAAVHMLLNRRDKKILYVVGIAVGLFCCFASGSRGGLTGLVLALGVFWVVSSRRSIFWFSIALLVVIIAYINLVPILEYLGKYFPIMSQRFLMSVLENDQSGRQEIRQYCVQIILDNSVFGYSYRLFPSQTGFNPHNGILEIFLALGIPFGLMYLFFIWIKGLLYSFKLMIDKRFFFATSMTVFVMVTAMSGGSIAEQYFGYAICLLGTSYYYAPKRVTHITQLQTLRQ